MTQEAVRVDTDLPVTNRNRGGLTSDDVVTVLINGDIVLKGRIGRLLLHQEIETPFIIPQKGRAVLLLPALSISMADYEAFKARLDERGADKP